MDPRPIPETITVARRMGTLMGQLQSSVKASGRCGEPGPVTVIDCSSKTKKRGGKSSPKYTTKRGSGSVLGRQTFHLSQALVRNKFLRRSGAAQRERSLGTGSFLENSSPQASQRLQPPGGTSPTQSHPRVLDKLYLLQQGALFTATCREVG